MTARPGYIHSHCVPLDVSRLTQPAWRNLKRYIPLQAKTLPGLHIIRLFSIDTRYVRRQFIALTIYEPVRRYCRYLLQSNVARENPKKGRGGLPCAEPMVRAVIEGEHLAYQIAGLGVVRGSAAMNPAIRDCQTGQ